jgi:hypothetical protein
MSEIVAVAPCHKIVSVAKALQLSCKFEITGNMSEIVAVALYHKVTNTTKALEILISYSANKTGLKL